LRPLMKMIPKGATQSDVNSVHPWEAATAP
jgi:hypothetical protein